MGKRKFSGYLELRNIEFEIEGPEADDDLAQEQAFNQAIQDRFNGGFDSSDNYWFEDVTEEEDDE